jgi:DNA-binding FadR family transcriptional regulator
LLLLQRSSLQEVYEIRRTIEVFLAKAASIRASEAQKHEIRKTYDLLVNASDDVEQALIADRNFHIAIADASANRLGSILVNAMMRLTVEMRRNTFKNDANFPKMHEEIYESFKSGDPNAVRQAMEKHFDMMETVLENIPTEGNNHPD